MRTAVWAIWYHKSSRDENPEHGLCPIPPDTWCPFRRAETDGSGTSYHHTNIIPLPVMEAIKPVFKDMSHNNLLKKCLHWKTQNVNEAFNNVLWTRLPKNVFVGKHTLELGTAEAVCTWNDGNISRTKIIQHLGISDVGLNTLCILKQFDSERIARAELAERNSTKEARRKMRGRSDEKQDNEDYYAPGGF